MKIQNFLLLIIVTSLYSAEESQRRIERVVDSSSRQSSSLRTVFSAADIAPVEKFRDSKEVVFNTKANERLLLIAALAKVGWEPQTDNERRTGVPEEPIDDTFWLRLHFKQHRNILAKMDTQ